MHILYYNTCIIPSVACLKVLYMSNNNVKDWGEFQKLAELHQLEDLLFVGTFIACMFIEWTIWFIACMFIEWTIWCLWYGWPLATLILHVHTV